VRLCRWYLYVQGLRRTAPLLAVLACSDRNARENVGATTVVAATTGEPNSIFPPLVSTSVGRQITEQIYDYLATIGPTMSTTGDTDFQPQLARTWTWSSDSLRLILTIDSAARWHDGQRVGAADVRFTFETYVNPGLGSSTGSQLSNIDSVSIVDSQSVNFWFKTRNPHQFFDATSQMQIIPRHIFGGMSVDSLLSASSVIKPIGTGRFRFILWQRGASIELAADTANYRGKPKIDRVIWRVTPSPVTASTMLFAGEADIYDTMRPENVKEAEARRNVKIVSAPSAAYVFMQFNHRTPKNQNKPHPFFSSRELRRALSMAVNRGDMVRNVFDSLAVPGIGPTVRAFPTTDTTLAQLPFDPARAARILDSLGWRKGKDGVRIRNGQRLQFSILSPASSLNRHRMAVLLQEQFRKIGVSVTLDEPEFSTFSTRLTTRDFDAALGSFHLGASAAAVKETWTSAAARKGGLNYGSYSNPDFDALVDSATSTMDPVASKRYYTAAYRIAIDDAPAIWLYEPRLVLGVNSRIKTGPIRPDAWWSNLADWYIPTEEHIPRDRTARR
jgi:peptide/nickel transport system substrate-binding protein